MFFILNTACSRLTSRLALLSILALLLPSPLSFAAAPAPATAQQQPATPAKTKAPAAVTAGQVQAVLKGMAQGSSFASVAISPDGSLLAYAHETGAGWRVVVAPFSDPKATTVVTASADAKKGFSQCGETAVAWSPDSRHLAFLGDCQTVGQSNIFLATLSGGPPDLGETTHGKSKIRVERLSDAKGEVGYPEFSPDGSKIGFLYVPGATREAGALAAMKPWAGVIGEDGIEIQRVATVDTSWGKAKAPVIVTPARLHVYEFDWSPDSKSLAYVAAEPPGENNWWVAKLYTGLLAGEPKTLLAPADISGPLHGLQIAVPRWSPDGKSIAFIAGLMSDQGSTGGDIWLVPSTGISSSNTEASELKNLTPGWPSTPAWFTWGDNSHLFVSELVGGDSRLVQLSVAQSDSSAGSPLYSIAATPGDGRLELSLSATRDRSIFVFSASAFDHPSEIYASHATASAAKGLDQLQQLTHENDGVTQPSGSTRSIEWKNEGYNIQGWLHFPKDYDPSNAGASPTGASKKYGLIVLVHGGPAAAVQSRWGGRNSLNGTAFSAMGYFVLEPNPRGSFGQGEAFTEANRKDFGYGDLRDILAGVDTVLGQYPVDPARVGLTGWSYGGFMTMFAVTQTQRFTAAVAGAGISDWKSYYGENSIDQWMTPYFGASVYQDPAVYAKSSAIDFIGQAKTPTLVVVGDRDGECPAPQSFEFWHALRDEHVPTQLVVYPNEGHGFVNPQHRTDVLVRSLEWFAKYMPPG